MPQFKPDDRDTVKKAAEKNAKAGDVNEIGNGLVYVRRDTRPVACMQSLVKEHGWYIDTVLFDDTGRDEHAFIIMPITEVPE